MLCDARQFSVENPGIRLKLEITKGQKLLIEFYLKHKNENINKQNTKKKLMNFYSAPRENA